MNHASAALEPLPDAVLFDYGNTLIAFDHRAIEHMNSALETALIRHFGKVDRPRLDDIRHRDRLAPYQNDHRENHLPTICANIVTELYGQAPSEAVLTDLLKARSDSFLEIVQLEDHVLPLLESMRQRYQLGLVSNYPDGEVIRESLRHVGIEHLFDTIVVSGEVGYAKPHPLPFQTACQQLRITPRQAVYIGDNWLGDIQGAKRLGMRAIHIRQYDTPEHFEPAETDHQPDAIIHHLQQLQQVLALT